MYRGAEGWIFPWMGWSWGTVSECVISSIQDLTGVFSACFLSLATLFLCIPLATPEPSCPSAVLLLLQPALKPLPPISALRR